MIPLRTVVALGALLAGGVAMVPPPVPGEPGEPAASTELATRTYPIVFRVTIEPKRGGSVLCALYRDEDNWLTDETFRGTRDDVSERVAICTFTGVPKGTYAMAALHDEDGDGEMDTNFIGLPQEGYAVSRNAHLQTVFAPDWADANFPHGAQVTHQWAKMKY